MTRPAVRTPARYGLPNSERVRGDLSALGLFSDVGPEPGSEEILTAFGQLAPITPSVLEGATR